MIPVVLLENAKDKLGRSFQESEIREQLIGKDFYGELGVPRGTQINLDRISHRITNIKEVGGNIVADLIVLDTPMGNILKSMLGEGVILTTSMRCLGKVSISEEATAVSDLNVITFDVVI
jgi:hypothetical protein